MTAEQVLRFQNAVPFKPFEVLLVDGRGVEVHHPDFVTVSEEDELLHIYRLPEGVEVIDLLLVVSLRFPIKRAKRKSS